MIHIDSDVINDLAKREHLEPNKLRKLIQEFKIVVLGNQDSRKVLIGHGSATKVNCNLGTSSMIFNEENELKKAKIAKEFGADTISDCSTMGNLNLLRKALISELKIPITTIPIYQAVAEHKSFEDISDEKILKVIEQHIKDKVSSIVIHAGFGTRALNYLKQKKRIMGVVSKGGSLCAAISLAQNRENPMITLFDEIIELLKNTDVVLNLGNAMRSGCIHDFKDPVQHEEIINNARLSKIANKNGVQVIIEGLGGHVNAYNLRKWVNEHKKITQGRPLFVAGPLPTEIGVGHDHISAAIGGAMAAGYGADYLCAITPAEHLSLPNITQIKEGVIAAKIAAHVGDSIKYGINKFFESDKLLSKSRVNKDWAEQIKYALDSEKMKEIHPPDQHSCSMCGNYCAISLMNKYLFNKENNKNG